MVAISWERVNPSGAWRATWVASDGFLESRVFYGYTKSEATRIVNNEIRLGKEKLL